MVLNLRTKETTLLYSDKLRVALLLKNIIGNSIKYRRKDVTAVIDVVVSAKDDRIEIIVQDNGEGISEKHLSKVFDMFYRGTTNGVGTGLGLYICKEIVDKLSGQIAITSILGEGTAVTIHLPRLK
jgi:signal transduction histidine kinase